MAFSGQHCAYYNGNENYNIHSMPPYFNEDHQSFSSSQMQQPSAQTMPTTGFNTAQFNTSGVQHCDAFPTFYSQQRVSSEGTDQMPMPMNPWGATMGNGYDYSGNGQLQQQQHLPQHSYFAGTDTQPNTYSNSTTSGHVAANTFSSVNMPQHMQQMPMVVGQQHQLQQQPQAATVQPQMITSPTMTTQHSGMPVDNRNFIPVGPTAMPSAAGLEANTSQAAVVHQQHSNENKLTNLTTAAAQWSHVPALTQTAAAVPQFYNGQHLQHQATGPPQVMTMPPAIKQISPDMPVFANYSTMSSGLEANLQQDPQAPVTQQHPQAFYPNQQLIDTRMQFSTSTAAAAAAQYPLQQSNSLHPPASVAQLNYGQHWQHQATGPPQAMAPPAMAQIHGKPSNDDLFPAAAAMNLQQLPHAVYSPQQPANNNTMPFPRATNDSHQMPDSMHSTSPMVVSQVAYGQQQQQAQLEPQQSLQQRQPSWHSKTLQQHGQMCNTSRNQIVTMPPYHYVPLPVPMNEANTIASNRAQLTNLPACLPKKRKMATQISPGNSSFRSSAAAMPFPPHVAGLRHIQPAAAVQQQPIANPFPLPPMAPAAQWSSQVPALTQSDMGQLEHCNQNQQQQQQWQMYASQKQQYAPVAQNVPVPMPPEANRLAVSNLSQLTTSISSNSSTGSSSASSLVAGNHGLRCAVSGCGTTKALRNTVPKKKSDKIKQKATTVKICQKCLNAFKRHINKFLELLVDEDMNIYYTNKYAQVLHDKMCTLRTRIHNRKEYNCEICHFQACLEVGCNAARYNLNEQTIAGGKTDWTRNVEHRNLAVIVNQLPLLPTMVATFDSFIERSLAKYRVHTATHMNWIATHRERIGVENLNPEMQYRHQWLCNDDINFLDAILDQIPFDMKEEYVDDFSTFFIHHITSAQNLSRRARSEDGNGIQEMNNQIMGRAQAVEALRDFIRNADDNKKALIKRMVQQCLAKQDKDKIGLWSTMDLEITLDIREWDKHNMREVVAIFLLLGIAIVESDQRVRSHMSEWLRFMRHRVASELFNFLKEKMDSPQSAAERFKQLVEFVEFMKEHGRKKLEFLGAAQKIGMSLYACVELTIKMGIFQYMARKEKNPELRKLFKELKMQQ